MLRNEAVHITSVYPNGKKARGWDGISYDGEARDENGMTIPVSYIEDGPLMQAAGIDVKAWDAQKDDTNTTAVDFYAITELKTVTERGKQVKRRKITEVMDADGYWWQYLSFGTHVKVGDKVLIEGKMDDTPFVVTVESVDRDKQGSTMYAVINGEHRIRTAQPVVVGRK